MNECESIQISNWKITMIRSIIKKTLAISLVATLVLTVAGMYAEPSLVNAAVATDEVVITLQVASGISITSPADTYMSNTLGVSQNTAIATSTWNVKTNNALGYTLTLLASTNPAMRVDGTTYINNFATTSTPTLWNSIPTGRSEFGYSGYGTDVSSGTWGSATDCGATSTPHTALKYVGLTTSAGITVATRSSTTTTSGVDTNICYAVEQKGVYVASGTYTATVTATATTL